MKRKVAIYARVSSEHEAQLSALENQIQYYDEILLKHPEWELYKRYIDEGITGTSVKKRKNFLKMIEDAKADHFDLIVTREVSRFARNTVDALQETRKLKKIGVEVYFTDDNIWTSNDDDGELRLTIMATLAQNESKKTSMRVKAGQMISFKNGVFYGTGNILGYDRIGDDMVINKKQAEIVKLIYKLYLEGLGSTKIKYELEKKGYVTASGLKNWSASGINRILSNPFYSGTIVYRKAYVPDYLEQKSVRNKGEVEQIVVEGRHEPLISKEDFQKVEKIRSKRRKKIPNTNEIKRGMPSSVYVSKLICECGSSFNRKTYHVRADGSKTYCYHCYHQKNFGSKNTRRRKGLDTEGACGTQLLPEWKIKCITFYIFEILWGDQNRIIDIANKLLDKSISEIGINYDEQKEFKEFQDKLKSIEDKSGRLLELYISEFITKDDFHKKKQELETDKKIIVDKLQDLNHCVEPPKEDIKSKIKLLKRTLKKMYVSFDDDISDEFVNEFVNSIKVKSDIFEWKLNILGENDDSDINRILLTRLAITKDDVGRYFEKHYQGSYNRAKGNIIVDIYI